MVYQTISAVALRLKANLQPQTVYGLQIKNSEEAIQYLQLLTAKRNKQSVKNTSIPVQSLYQALRLLPGLIHIGQLSCHVNDFLVYSSQRLAETSLSAIIDYWIELEFPEKPTSNRRQGITEEERNEAKNCFSPDNLTWVEKTVSYSSNFNTYRNGTANLANDDFILLPYIIAAELTKPEHTFTVDGQPLKFYRTTSSKFQPIELISWNPLKAEIEDQNYYYSIVLKIKVETVPYQSYPEIQIKPSIRRWLSLPNSELSHSHSSNAYILTDSGWGEPVNPDNFSECFVSYPMKMDKQTINKKNQWIPSWKNKNRTSKLLSELGLLSATPQEILSTPANYLQSNSKESIGVVFKEGMTSQHEISKGLPTFNVQELYEQINNIEFISSHFYTISYQRETYKTGGQSEQSCNLERPVKSFDEPIVKHKAETEKEFEARKKRLLKTQTTKSRKCNQKKRESEAEYQFRLKQLIEDQKQELETLKLKPEETDDEFAIRLNNFKQEQKKWQSKLRTAIVNSGINNLTIWLWYIKDDNLKDRLKAIQYCLGIPKLEDGSYPSSEGLTINIKTQAMGEIAEKLEFTDDKKPNREQIIEATKQRFNEIQDIVKSNKNNVDENIGIWVELYGQEIYKFTQKTKKYSPWCDPKNAIRLGFAKLGFVNQFITPERKSYQHKAITSLMDLLRQLGVRISPSNLKLNNLDADNSINEVGLWLVNKTGKTTIDNQSLILPVMVRMCSDSQQIQAIFPGSEWMPYSEALTKINEAESWKNDNQGKTNVRTFIKSTLKTKELRDKPTILYCKAENLRTAWTWLQDTQISNQGLSFGEKDKPLFEEFNDLRVIRLRNTETPEWYLVDTDGLPGTTKGLFKKETSQQVFYSVAEKSTQMPRLKKDISKIKNPEKSWAHQSLLEIFVSYHQEKDNLTELATIAHESRKGVLQYSDFLEVPRVLHYAKQMNEYVLMVNEDEDEDENEDV